MNIEIDLEFEHDQLKQEQLRSVAERMARFLYWKCPQELWVWIKDDVSLVSTLLEINPADNTDFRMTTQARAAKGAS